MEDEEFLFVVVEERLIDAEAVLQSECFDAVVFGGSEAGLFDDEVGGGGVGVCSGLDQGGVGGVAFHVEEEGDAGGVAGGEVVGVGVACMHARIS
jgi:hypothetical protein